MLRVILYLIICGTAVHALTGCSINVIVAPGATLGVHSDLSQTATQRHSADVTQVIPLPVDSDAGLIE
jgi:hypothetical protein